MLSQKRKVLVGKKICRENENGHFIVIAIAESAQMCHHRHRYIPRSFLQMIGVLFRRFHKSHLWLIVRTHFICHIWFTISNLLLHKNFSFSVMMVAATDKNEYRLTKHLLTNYDKSVRPARLSSEPVNVTFGLALTQIIDVVSLFLKYCFMFFFLFICCIQVIWWRLIYYLKTEIKHKVFIFLLKLSYLRIMKWACQFKLNYQLSC